MACRAFLRAARPTPCCAPWADRPRPGGLLTRRIRACNHDQSGEPSGNTLSTTSAFPRCYGDAVLADNPVGYWRLDETTGTTAADSKGTRPGTYANGVTLGQAGALPDTVDNRAASVRWRERLRHGPLRECSQPAPSPSRWRPGPSRPAVRAPGGTSPRPGCPRAAPLGAGTGWESPRGTSGSWRSVTARPATGTSRARRQSSTRGRT